MLAAVNNVYSSLAQTAAAGDTSILLANASAFPSSGIAVIAGNANPLVNEVVYYTGKSGNSLTGCTRGYDGTTAETHVLGTMVAVALVAKHITDLQPKHGSTGARAALALTLTIDDTGRRFYDLTEDRLYEWVGNRWESSVVYVGRAIRDFVGTQAEVLPQFYQKGDRWTDLASAVAMMRVCKTDSITHTIADWVVVGRQG
jgi:hypothetical protein